MNPLSLNYLAKMFARDSQSTFKCSLLAAPYSHRLGFTFLWIVGITLVSLLHFLMHFAPVTLHDASHYVTAGMSLIRDHKDLLYPYSPLTPGRDGPAYEYFQNHTIIFDVRTNYPSKLWTALYGIICSFAGKMRLEYFQWMSFFAYLTANIFLYLVGRRFLCGLDLLAFMIAVTFMPVMVSVVDPGSDGIGLASSLFLLWLCLCVRVNPFVLGLCFGIVAQFRGQLLSLFLVYPLIYTAISNRTLLRGALLPMLAGAGVTYSSVSLAFNLWVGSQPSTNPVAFYTDYFSISYKYAQWGNILKKGLINLLAIFDKNQMYFYPVLALGLLFRKGDSLEKNMTKAGLLYALFPIVLYSIDATTTSQPRYYVFSVALIALASFIAIKEICSRGALSVPARGIFLVIATLVLSTWYITYGFPILYLHGKSVVSRARFLDFEGVQESLDAHFKVDDIVIINHALITGLSKLHNVIFVPDFKEFQAGDNSKIKGIVFIFGDTPPNDYFKPKDWLQGADELPLVIKDSKGITFQQVYAKDSNVILPNGKLYENAHFYIYQNTKT